MWECAEEAYNEILGHKSKKIKLVPVLPNLITTTDKVTIFVTSSIVNQKEPLYIAARPQELNNEMSSSAFRNIY